MSNQSSSKEGKGRTDETQVDVVAEKSHLESARPPPPSNPSSSSSTAPPTSQDPSHLNFNSVVSSSSGDPIAAQLAHLFSVVARLSSENEALKAQAEAHSSQLEAHSSTNSRLSSENEELRQRVEGVERTMEEMSKAFGSHWVWEAGRGEGEGGKGRWTWSGEKHRRAVLRVAHSKPPPSLDSIPVELITSIFTLLDRPDHLALCGVSFRLLQVASKLVYGRSSALGSKAAASFVSTRASNLNPSSSRIATLLLPFVLNLLSADFDASHFTPLSVTGTHPFQVQHVAVHATTPSSLPQWSPVLSLLDPFTFSLFGPLGTDILVPSAVEVSRNELHIFESWTRLHGFGGTGAFSIPLLPGPERLFALSECLDRCHPGRRWYMKLAWQFFDGREDEFQKVEAEELSAVLASGLPPDATGSRMSLRVTAIKRQHGGVTR